MPNPREMDVTNRIVAIPNLVEGVDYFAQSQSPLTVLIAVGPDVPASADAPGLEIGASHYFRLEQGESAWVWLRGAGLVAKLVWTEAV